MRVSSLDQRHDDCRFWDEVHRHVNTFKIIPVFRALPVLRCVRLDGNVLGLRQIMRVFFFKKKNRSSARRLMWLNLVSDQLTMDVLWRSDSYDLPCDKCKNV